MSITLFSWIWFNIFSIMNSDSFFVITCTEYVFILSEYINSVYDSIIWTERIINEKYIVDETKNKKIILKIKKKILRMCWTEVMRVR